MVSPSKKQKVNGKWVRLKDSDSGGKSNPHKQDDRKPLLSKRYYLDVKNQQEVKSLTKDLESLGAVIEEFLSKEVDVIVSDQQRVSGSGVGGGGGGVVQNGDSGKGSALGRGSGTGRQLRSRVETMIDQAQRKRRGTSDLLTNAQRWGAQVWSLAKALAYISELKKKKCATTSPQTAVRSGHSTVASINSNNRRASLPVVSVRRLTVPYIKVEDCERVPIYREFARWPVLRVRTGSLSSPFEDLHSQESKRRRVATCQPAINAAHPKRSPRRARDSVPVKAHNPLTGVTAAGGAKEATPQLPLRKSYCEICGVTYRNLSEHLRCDLHLRFVNDQSNYEELDRLIRGGNSPSQTDMGLQVFKGTSVNSHSEGEPVRRCLRSARFFSDPALSVSAKGLTLRNGTTYGDSQMTTHWTNNFVGKEKESERRKLLEGTLNGQRKRNVTHNNNINSSALSGGECDEVQVNGDQTLPSAFEFLKHRRKKVAGDQKFLRDNEQYYKVEVLPSKLRSSRPKEQVNGDCELKEDEEEEEEEKDDNDDHDDEEDVSVKEEKEEKEEKTPRKRRQIRGRRTEAQMCLREAEAFLFGEQEESGSSDSGASDSEETDAKDEAKHRRRSCELRLLSDNQEYYKFEILSSKLRSTHRIHRRASEEETEEKKEEVKSEELKKEEEEEEDEDLPEWMRQMQFSFETVPQGEPWFQTYTRQDQGEEPEAKPSTSSPQPNMRTFLLPYELPPESVFPKVSTPVTSLSERRRNNMAAALPRKSPRCHASTLALLMGLSRQRRGGSSQPDALQIELEAYLKGGGVVDEEAIKAAGHEVASAVAIERRPSPPQRGRPRKNFRRLPSVVNTAEKFPEPDVVVDIVNNFSSCVCLDKVEADALVPPANTGESGSECTSLCDTASEADSTATLVRRVKKRKRNLTGWPRDKPKPKKKPPLPAPPPLPGGEGGEGPSEAVEPPAPSSNPNANSEASSNPVSPGEATNPTIHRREFPRQAKSQILVKVDYLPRSRKSV